MKLPPLNALRAFEAAARLSSFSKAGDELSVTHAAVSHQIRNLEAWFGRPLFRRDGRGIKLTRTGEDLKTIVSTAFASISEKALALQNSHDEEIVVVGCLASIASRWLIPALPSFREQFPKLAVQMFYVHPADRLDFDAFEVLISMDGSPTLNYESVKLFSRRSLPVASPYYLEKRGPIASARAVAEADLLHDVSRDDWRGWCQRAGLPEQYAGKGHIFADFNMLATAVMAGHGVALCPVEVFHREIAAGDLVLLSDIHVLENEAYYLAVSATPSDTVRAFRDWFIGVCRTADSAARG